MKLFINSKILNVVLNLKKMFQSLSSTLLAILCSKVFERCLSFFVVLAVVVKLLMASGIELDWFWIVSVYLEAWSLVLWEMAVGFEFVSTPMLLSSFTIGANFFSSSNFFSTSFCLSWIFLEEVFSLNSFNWMDLFFIHLKSRNKCKKIFWLIFKDKNLNLQAAAFFVEIHQILFDTNSFLKITYTSFLQKNEHKAQIWKLIFCVNNELRNFLLIFHLCLENYLTNLILIKCLHGTFFIKIVKILFKKANDIFFVFFICVSHSEKIFALFGYQ